MTLEIVRGHPKPPKGNHHFPCHGLTFRARDVDELILAITTYRMNNSLPLGHPEAEIADYYVGISPWLVRESNAQPVASNGLRQIVAEHTMAMWYGKYERLPAHSPITDERSAVCVACEYSDHHFSDPETSYWNDATTKAALMTGDMDCVKKGFCLHHRWLLALACRLVTPEKLASLPSPDCCWCKTT